MLSVRNVILGSLFVFALSLGFAIAAMIGPPDSQGKAVDSYGTRRDGFRAAYELLSAVDVSVTRSIEPPSPTLATSTTLVLWMPHDDLVLNEPAYLERLLPWIKAGGRLVVAIPPAHRVSLLTAARNPDSEKRRDIWSVLNLDGIHIVPITVDDENGPLTAAQKRVDFGSSQERRQHLRRSVETAMGLHPIEFKTVPLEVAGRFKSLRERAKEIQIPSDDVGGLELPTPDSTSGKLNCVRSDGSTWTIAASFQQGLGEVIVVAEPMVLMNASLGRGDNSVLAYDLLASTGRNVVFDEFYHGLSVRGNPLWLMTKSTYATVIVVMLGLLGLELWRRAIWLGPPLEAPAKSRRTIVEYIEAMARFLNRSRGSRPFLLNEIREGTMHVVGARLGLSPNLHNIENIATAMSKRSVHDADQFRRAMTMLDTALAKDDHLSESEAIRVIQGISRCL